MIYKIKNPNPPVYYIAWKIGEDGKRIFSCGFIKTNQQLETSLPNREVYEHILDFKAKLIEYGIDYNDWFLE